MKHKNSSSLHQSFYGNSPSHEVLRNRTEAINSYNGKENCFEIIAHQFFDEDFFKKEEFYKLNYSENFKDRNLLIFFLKHNLVSPSQIGIGVSTKDGVDFYNKQWVHANINLDLKIIIKFTDGKVEIFVRTLEWTGPHDSIEKWTLAKTLTKNISINNLKKAVISILINDKFFINCEECGEWVPEGYSTSDSLCCTCAESVLKIVF